MKRFVATTALFAPLLLLPRGCSSMMHHAMFRPLSCNADLSSAPCRPFSEMGYDLSQEVIIPCGECVVSDLGGAATFSGGLDVIGKLKFESDSEFVRIRTPHVFVQGELEIDVPSDSIPSSSGANGVEFVLTGNTNVAFDPHEGNNQTKCATMGGCDVSVKPVVVAGGKLNVRGMPDSCPSWGKLRSVVREGPPVPPTSAQAPTPKDQCSRTLVNENFEGGTADGWDGFTSPVASVLDDPEDGGNGYYGTRSRTASYQGPRVSLDVSCIVPLEPYLLRFKYRLRRSDGSPSLAETHGGSHLPWIKMIRTKVSGGNDWLSPDLVYPRGSLGKAQDGEWHEMQYVVRFKEEQADPTLTAALYLYLQTLDVDADVDLDEFRLELAPTEAFPSVENACVDLLQNSDAVQAGGHAYPFYASNGGSLFTLPSAENDGPPGHPADGRFFRMDQRTSEWTKVLSQELNPYCLTAGSSYGFSAKYRVHSDTPRHAEIQVWTKHGDGTTGYHTIVSCPPSSNDWVDCTGQYTFTEDHEGAEQVWFHARIPSDADGVADFADVELRFSNENSGAKKLILERPDGVRGCWNSGAEVLITSRTNQWDDAQVAVVESVEPDGTIVLEDAVANPISMDDDPDAAVEVALLSRNVRFVAEHEEGDDELIGGHLIVLHTMGVPQLLQGAEMRGFGQQGNLGRYPIHFHMCDSALGSVVSKNVVRESNQRCVVLHNTDDVEVVENVAYDTKGHCFILEDGGETNNVFSKNLGANTGAVERLISSDESDHVPSTFWITNPDNTWIGNVAAGSTGSGFWFEVRGSVRGPSAMFHPDVDPSALPLKLFVDNVSHSNSRNGLQTYPQRGYRPIVPAVFRNHRSYRNRRAGIFFHAGGKLEVEGGRLSDNLIGVDIDMDHSDAIRDVSIVGVSPAYRAIVDSMGSAAALYPARDQCASDSPVVGVRLDAYHWGGTRATGTQISNVTFAGFGPTAGGCDGSVVMDVNSGHGSHGFFDPRTSLENVEVTDGSSRVDLCRAEEAGFVDVAIHDRDGSFATGGGGVPGFLVSDVPAMTADARCSSLPGTCAAFCPGVCLRTVAVAIPADYYHRPELQLEIGGASETGEPIVPIVVTNQQEEVRDPKHWDATTRLYVALPAGGSYTARFTMGDGVAFWPTFADVSYEDAPGGCGPDFGSFEIERPDPQPACDELVRNGDAGDAIDGGSDEGWTHIAGGVSVAPLGADGTPHSLWNKNRVDEGGKWYGIAQHLDTRCMIEGRTYALRAKVKLTLEDGTPFHCNADGYSGDPMSCPSATVRFGSGLTDAEYEWTNAGRLETGDEDWNVLSGTFAVSAFGADAGRASLYINGAPEGVDIYVDSVSVVPATKAPTTMPSGSPIESPTTTAPPPPVTTVPIDVPPLYYTNADVTDAVSFEADGAVDFVASNQEEATVLTKEPHGGLGPSGTLDLDVEFLSRSILEGGYQPLLVLFFAPASATVDDVTTNDNGWPYFEGAAVAFVTEKIYATMDHTWFSLKARGSGGDGALASQSASTAYKLMAPGRLRLHREGGFVTAFHSPDGLDETRIGSPMELPDEHKFAPLKLGMRIKRNWKSTYDMKLRPSIVSAGPAAATADTEGNAPPPPPPPAFDASTADFQNMAAPDAPADGVQLEGNAVVFASAMGKEEMALTKSPVASSTVEITVQYLARQMYGTGYQSGLALFFAPEGSTIDDLATNDNGYGSFENAVVATVRDKVHATIDHTWFHEHVLDPSGSTLYQPGGDSYKMVSGYLRLRREDGRVTASHSMNGMAWKDVAAPVELPDSMKGAPVKVGMRVKRNYMYDYYIKVVPVIKTV